MAKQGKGGPTPPPDDKDPGESDILEVVPEDEPAPPKRPPRKPAAETHLASDVVEEVVPLPDDKGPGESDILEVVPEDEPAPPKKPVRKAVPETHLGSSDLIEEIDLVDEVDLVEEAGPAQPKIEKAEAKIEEVKGHAPPPAPEPAAAFEEVHEIDLWEDEPAEVEVVGEAEGKKPEEAAPPKAKTPPDDVAGADDFVEIIDPAATLTASLPPADLHDEDLIIDVTPGPQSSPTGKGDLAARADKIAEALESGTDLTGERQALRPPAPVEPPEVDYASDLDKSGESSAVDLGEPAPTKERDKGAASDDLLADALAEAEAGPKEFVGKPEAAAEEAPVEVVAAEDEGPPAKGAKKKPGRKPAFGLNWVAGIVIGLVLGGGAVAGLAFTGLLGPSEKKAPPPLPAGPKVTLAQQAHSAVDRGDYDEAIQLLQGADKTSPEELAVRGEARWLKYLKEQNEKKAPPSAKDEAVKQALADLKEAKDEVRQQQITLALGGGPDEGTKQLLKKTESNLAEVRKQLQNAEQRYKKAQAENENLAGKQKTLAENVTQLVEARKKLDASLAQINTQLKEAKVPAEGAQGVSELVAAKAKVEAERGRLDTVVKQAIQELEAGQILPPGATVKDLVAGVKAARERSDSPLAAPLAKGVSLLAGANEQVARWLQQNAKNAAIQTELALYRLREPLIKTPEKRLDSWITRLRSGAAVSPADLDEARRDAEWVLANSGKSVPELKLKAEFVQALAARDRGESAQARALLARIAKETAAKDPAAAAEASFDLGRLDEAQGDLAKAEAHYRQAIKMSKGSSQAAHRYRAALGRVILMRMDASPVDVPPAKEQKTGRLDPPVIEALLLTTLIGGGEEGSVSDKRLQEALDLANDLLKSENREDKGNAHLILGKVYTIQGKKTEGLKEYVIGLQLIYPGLATKDLSRMIESHPAFQQPDSLVRPNVAVASQHYGRGLQRFWNRQYPQAEKELKQAVANYPEDARYRYFLGLSRYLQNSKAKREAAVFDFEQAARLEQYNRPDSVAVNSSFERLPFALRQMLNRYRQKTPTPPAEEVAGR